MTIAEESYSYITPVDRVRYDGSVFEAPLREGPDLLAEDLVPDVVGQFHAIVEQLTDRLMSLGDFDRASCRADAITMLTKASERLQQKDTVESPLAYMLREEQQRAAAAIGSSASTAQATIFLKV